MTAVVKAKARTQNLILDAALKLARRGWHVFPVHWPIDNQCSCRNRNCSSPAKHPLTPNGFKDATLDTTVINEYWTKWPAANIGIATGALSGIIVIDVDSLDAEDQLKAALAPWDGLQSIPRSSTGRGCHLVFAYPGFEIKSRARLLPKIDVRADGGYFIVEPSKHISGKQYLWQVTPGAELPKMPAELLRLISNPSAADSNGIRERFDSRTIWEGINKGERDQEVFRYACWLRRLDVPADVAEKLILEAAARCNPPFSERAVLKKIEQAWKYSAGQSDRAIPADKLEPQLFETMDTVIEEEIDFLWDKRIPCAKMTLFDGDPGVGKSYFALAVAAKLSTGEALPFDREPEAPLRSLIISSEDGAGDTIKPRLRMLGADMSMIVIPNRSLNLTPSTIDANMIDRILGQTGCALTIIDPIIAFANGRNTDRASEVRGLLGPLASIAEKHKTAVVLIRHLNKSTQGKALYRGQGSIDFVAACRAAFIFAQDPENPERRMMAHSKASIAGLQSTVEFFIDKGTGAFRWGGETNETADEIMTGGDSQKGREMEKAREFLVTALSAGPMASNELKRQAGKIGIAARTLWRAKTKIGTEAKKHPSADGEWWWRIENIGVWPWLVGGQCR